MFRSARCGPTVLNCLKTSKRKAHLLHGCQLEGFASAAKNQLYLHNTFTKEKEPVVVDGEPVTVGHGARKSDGLVKIYVCGPTVYDHCHLGHALTYVRFDLFRRALTSFCGLSPIVGMGITDIDDKIIAKANSENKPFRQVTEYYFSSFIDDLISLNIKPPTAFLRVTDHVDAMIAFISKLKHLGFAYVSEVTGDINFDSEKFPNVDERESAVTEKSVGKRSPRDFALWKVSKKDEPQWLYRESSSDLRIYGRPGLLQAEVE